MFTVYIIESLSSSEWYYGFTTNLEQRFDDHQTNRSKFTRFKGPWKLIFSREFDDSGEALRFERYLKRVRNKEYIRRAFSSYFL